MSSPWIILCLAGVMETCWIISMKYSEGFTRLLPSAATIGFLIVSMYLLSQAIRDIPLGTAYAVWTGIGAVGAVIMGIVLFDEPSDALRILFIILVVIGIVGLQATSISAS